MLSKKYLNNSNTNNNTIQQNWIDFFDEKINSNIDITKNKVLEILEIKDTTLIINEEEVNNLNQEELWEYILDKIEDSRKKWKKIDKVDFWNNYSSNIKQKINQIIWENYPLLNIHRLVPGHDVLNINFLWIKNLNEKISKEFVDLFINKFKDYLINNFEENLLDNQNQRLVRNNYKNITFSLPKNQDIQKILFNNQKNKSDIIDYIFNSIDSNELQNILNISWKNIKIEKVKNILMKYFDFNIWLTNLWVEKNSTKQKLEEFYKSEIASRSESKSQEIEVIKYDFNKIKNLTKKAFEIEEKIINKYLWKKIEVDWIDYPIIKILPNWEKIISDQIIRLVRKQKKLPNKSLENLIRKYIENLTNWYDFIAPVLYISQFEEAKKIDQNISSGKINAKYFKKNYKWTYSRIALEKLTQDKKWTRFFIDIVDMWIMNLSDFRARAKEVQKWEINQENIDLLIESWFSVTEKFQQFIRQISGIPWLKISLWGDEIYLFYEWTSKEEIELIIEKVNLNLKNYQLKWRITYDNEKYNKNIFHDLDIFTIINKSLENVIEKNIIINNLVINQPNSICLNIENSIRKKIIKDINNFIWNFEKYIDYKKIKNILIKENLENKKIAFFDWYSIFLKKDINNNLTLEIKNN